MLEVAIRKQRRDLSVAAEFTLAEGASLGLFGPSGAGKSTILNCLAGLESPDAGRIVLDGEAWFPPPLAVHRRRVGYLAQQPCLFPHLTVAANVTFAGRARSAWVDELRSRLALDACWDAPVHKLSGGQARRVALARMLLRRPPLLLLDEPFTGLDRANVRAMLAALQAWRAAIGFSLIAVDHQPEVLEQMTDAVISMDQGHAAALQSWESLRANPAPALQALLDPLYPPIRTIARSGL